MKSRDVIEAIEKDGWHLVRVKGSHHHFRHSEKSGTVTIPHPKSDLTRATLPSIEKQSGVTLR